MRSLVLLVLHQAIDQNAQLLVARKDHVVKEKVSSL